MHGKRGTWSLQWLESLFGFLEAGEDPNHGSEITEPDVADAASIRALSWQD